ncbi:hypothetical protein BT67DRAFT_92170 [Trichocladium antarcticum]|uniref:Protein kinase domain-containing protein n=1 Tax=Trichocladium antarcticum TaxID=1450529 RepID=A0AAN6UFS0_9PEZI|nr:hypothetical protein BT67DRAFT_92170 [Trichocladium antarcticum]
MERTSNYRILGFTTANEGEEPPWFSLEVRLHNSRFRISVTLSNFRNSPAQFEEFHKYFALLLSENNDHGDGSFEGTGEEGEQEEQDTPPGRATLVDCFDWAISPCLTHFERLSPPPLLSSSRKLTLSHFLATTSFEYDLIATDEVLVPGEIERLETDEDCEPPPGGLDDRWLQSTPWTTSFPSFTPADIVVVCDNPQHPFDSNPAHVRIGQQRLYFKASLHPDDTVARKEVRVYERIASADLGDDVRTSRLYGIVRDERDQLVGLLLYSIEEDTPLTFAVGPETPDAVKDRWAEQIQHTLAALHRAGITWGDAKPDNILIDVHGDAWIIDFGGGRTEGWVDSDKTGTVGGD